MKKNIFTIVLIFVIIIVVLFMNYKEMQNNFVEVNKFNSLFENCNNEKINGLDIATLINKAIDNNEKFEIAKDKDGLYISDDEYSIKIFIKMIINNKTYPMEKFNAAGIEGFIENFGTVEFKCSNIKYHKKTGRISEITFESIE